MPKLDADERQLDADERRNIARDFKSVVNMAPAALRRWLKARVS
jgi:hypothetical protein